jgi:tetratricopeptide (TPR) repeat protein
MTGILDLLAASDDYGEACRRIEALHQEARRSGLTSALHQRLASVHLGVGNHGKAAQEATNALRLDPASTEAHYVLALGLLGQAMSGRPERLHALLRRAAASLGHVKDDEARELREQVLDLLEHPQGPATALRALATSK